VIEFGTRRDMGGHASFVGTVAINVTGFVGFLSEDVGRLFGTTPGGDARAWFVSPAVSWPAFDMGSVRARLRANEAQSDAAAAKYEKVVLTASKIPKIVSWPRAHSKQS
jgi:hypothetical protein